MPRPAPPPPEHPTPRELVGQAVKSLIAYRGMTITEAGLASNNCAKPTIDRIIRGEESVGDGPLLSLAGTLRLPVNTFLLMLDMDVPAIKRLSMDAEAKEYILNLLEPPKSTEPTRRRKATGE